MRLKNLLRGWSFQSGELPDVIMINLCDQDSRRRFPPGTFRLQSTGDWSDPGDLGRLVNQMRYSGYDSCRDNAAETLDHVLVSKKGVLEYCAKYGVRPPACVAGHLRRPFFWRAKNAAPSLYPSTPEEIADEQKRLESEKAATEVAHFEFLKSSANKILNNLRGILETIDNSPSINEKGYKYFWADQWYSEKIWIQSDIESLPHCELRDDLINQLDQLEAEFQSLCSTKLSQTSGKSNRRTTVAAEKKAERYLKEQVNNGNWLPKMVHYQLAKEQIGEHLSKRGFLRKWDAKVPSEWRKPGRPPLSGF